MTDTDALALRSLERLLSELLDGPPPEEAFVLNAGDRGLLASLDRLSSDAASAHAPGRSSVAAHVDHLHYGFGLLNRWAQGEDPWGDADWAASWQRQEVGAEQWRELRAAFAKEAKAWRGVLKTPRAWDAQAMTIALANTVHLAYHLGAIRQIDQGTAGPPA